MTVTADIQTGLDDIVVRDSALNVSDEDLTHAQRERRYLLPIAVHLRGIEVPEEADSYVWQMGNYFEGIRNRDALGPDFRDGTPEADRRALLKMIAVKRGETPYEVPRSMILPCIRCGVLPESVDPGRGDNQPYAATAFSTGGHYGSTVFDPMNHERLEINVCDPCLRVVARDRLVLHYDGHESVTHWNAPGYYNPKDR
jgi:hypothetical protein